MAFKIIEQGRKPNTIWQEFICDTNEDVSTLPTDCPAGSRAIVAQNGDLYLLDLQGNWNPMPRGGGGGGSSEQEIFIVTSSTTFAEVEAAIQANKFCVYKNYIYSDNFYAPMCVYVQGSQVGFSQVTSPDSASIRYLSYGNQWTVYSIPLKEVFVVDLGVTPYADIENAVNNGLFCVLRYERLWCPLVYKSTDSITFGAVGSPSASEKLKVYSYTINDQDEWSENVQPLSSIYFVNANITTFMEIVNAVSQDKLPVINDIANGRTYYVSGYTMSGSDPVAIRFCTLEKDDSGLRYTWTVDYQDNWTSDSYMDGLYYVVPGTTTFMEIVGLLTKCTQPVINDTVNGRAYYISDYTMVGGQPAAITFSTIGANTPHTWTVDYQDNWTST